MLTHTRVYAGPPGRMHGGGWAGVFFFLGNYGAHSHDKPRCYPSTEARHIVPLTHRSFEAFPLQIMNIF